MAEVRTNLIANPRGGNASGTVVVRADVPAAEASLYDDPDTTPDADLSVVWAGTPGESMADLIAPAPAGWTGAPGIAYYSARHDAIALTNGTDQTSRLYHPHRETVAGERYTWMGAILAEVEDIDAYLSIGGSAAGGGTASDPVTLPAGQWVTEHSGIESVGGSLILRAQVDMPGTIYLRLGLIGGTDTYVGAYFDGDTPDVLDVHGRGWTYEWTDTPGASTSTATYVWFTVSTPLPDYPLRITVYHRNFGRVGWVNAPREAHVTPRWNLPGTCTFTLDEDHPQAATLATKGARVLVEYMGLTTPQRLLSGVVSTEGARDGETSTITYTVKDDKAIWWELLGWVKPDGTILQQGDDDAYYTVTGTAEYVAKQLVTVNKAHIATPITVAPDLGRGDDVTATLRMHPLADRILPAVDLAGIGLDAYQDGAGITIDILQGVDRTNRPPLTEASGVVLAGGWSQTPPTVTRVVVAGPGEGTARKFAVVKDLAAEAAWGVSIEQVRDARDLDEASPTLQADLERRGQETLDEGAAQVTITAQLAETAHFRVGVAYWLGDLVPVQLTGAPVLTDRVRSIDFDLTPDEGLVITPHIGVDDTFASVTTKHIARLAAGLRDLRVSR